MTEAEIVLLMQEFHNRVWSIMQWWVSISFGLLVVAHVASEKLNVFTLSVLISLYTLFSLWIGQILGIMTFVVEAYNKDLEALAESSTGLMIGTSSWLDEGLPDPALTNAVFLGTFVCVISYLVYSYWKSRHK